MLALRRVHATAKEVIEKGGGRGREVPRSKAKESPMVGSNPRRKEVIIVGNSRANAIDAEQGAIGPVNVTPPNTSLTFTNKVITKGKVNMSPTSSLSLKLKSATTRSPAQVVETSKWTKDRTTFLDDFDIFGDLQ